MCPESPGFILRGQAVTGAQELENVGGLAYEETAGSQERGRE